MSNDLPYPTPPHLHAEIEALLGDLPDREETVYRLRRHFGRVYAEGYRDGRLAATTEAYYDRSAPTSPAPATPAAAS